jgi:prepilin-type N-terminal cleavage/methylation domain-containing protein
MPIFRAKAFTLSELLIALVILGVIAAFTIPNVLQSQQDKRFNAIAKETAGMITGAYDAYRLNNAVTASTDSRDLTPYMNYVSINTSITIDGYQTDTTQLCSSTTPCLRLHNGAILLYSTSNSFCDTGTTSAVYYFLDPDGQYSGSTNGPGKSVVLWIYIDGSVRSYGTLKNSTRSNSGCTTFNPTPAYDPPWFSWE